MKKQTPNPNALSKEGALPRQRPLSPEDRIVDVAKILADLRNPRFAEFPFWEALVDQVEDHLNSDTPLDEALTAVAIVDRMLGHMRANFASELKFYDPKDVEIAGGQGISGFDWLGRQTLRLQIGLSAQNPKECAFALLQMGEGLDILQASFRQVKALSEAEPRYSDSPEVQEICRVGELALAKKVAPQALEDRVLPYQERHLRFTQELAQFRPSALEACSWKTECAALSPTLAGLGAALRTIAAQAEAGGQPLTEALENLRIASEQLAQIEDNLRQALSAPDSEAEDAVQRLGAVFLDPTGSEALPLVSAEAGLGPNLKALLYSIRNFSEEPATRERVVDEINRTQTALDWVLGQMDKLPSPPVADASAGDEVDTYAKSRDALGLALANIEGALHLIRDGLVYGNATALEQAQRLIVRAGEQFHRLEGLTPNSMVGPQRL